jgi:parallel beta-helix repeat protein
MGLRVAVANGNWSNPSTWEGGILPTATDVAATNGFVVNIDQDITVEGLTNLAHYPSAIPPMVDNDFPGGVVTTSGTFDPSYDSWKAFNFSTDTFQSWIHTNGVVAGWLAYEFKIPKVINKYVVVRTYANQLASMPRDWTFEGWTGSTWVVLHTVTGHNSLTPYTGTFTNTTAYKKYRINITANNGGSYSAIDLMYMGLTTDPTTTSNVGGSFTVTPGRTITCTQIGLLGGGNNVLITLNSTGTYNIIGDIIKQGSVNVLNITANCTVNIVGDIKATFSGGRTIQTFSTCTLNITGNILGPFSNNSNCLYLDSVAAVYITGNITSNNRSSGTDYAIFIVNSSRCEITGNVFHNYAGQGIIINNSGLLRIVGTLNAKAINLGGFPVIYNDYSSSATNLFSGPFVFSESAHSPIMVARMNLIRTFNSYVEFRDNSTNGALLPALQAPATRLVSPDTVADAPSPNNVRQGIAYSLGALTGTMIVPSPSNVANNVPVDNTVGTAVLDASSIWAVPLTNLNILNSIGRRVKNAATVETTGAQIQATLNDNE